MSFILKLKHWQVFILIIIFSVLSNFSIEGDSQLTKIISFFGILFFLLWPLVVGNELYQYVPRNITLKYNLFIINGLLWIVASAVLVFFFDGHAQFEGLAALCMFYLIYAIVQFMSFPAKTLKTIELNRQALLSEYFMDFMLFLFLPIGIWFLQPRFNKITSTQA